MNLSIILIIFARILFAISTDNSSNRGNDLISIQQRNIFEKWMVYFCVLSSPKWNFNEIFLERTSQIIQKNFNKRQSDENIL